MSSTTPSVSPTLGFSDWLRTLADGPPPIRDLAQDFIMGAEEGTNESEYQTPESFRIMLEGEHACDAAIRTFEEAAEVWSGLTGIPLVPYRDENGDESSCR